MKKYYLTKNGNILNVEKKCFQTTDGKFLRRVFKDEMEYLVEVLTPIDFPDGIKEPDEPEIWEYLWEVEDVDMSQYQPDRCCNGGCYSFTCKTLFFTRMNNGEREFCRLEKWSTSSEFPYTSDGNFARDVEFISIIDTDIDLYYKIECNNNEYEEEETEAELLSFAFLCPAKVAFNAKNSYRDQGDWVDEELSIEERLYRYKKLKKYGINLLEIQKNRRRQKPVKKIY